MPKPLTFFLLSLSIFFFFPTTSDGSAALAVNCPSNNCGNLTIEYPFWLMSETTSNQYCGYPSFNLSCSDEQAIFNLPGDSYYVKYINYADFTLTLVDIDAATSQTCPRVRHNVTIRTLPLSYNRLDLNLSFFYNCTDLPTIATPISCLSSGGNESYVFVVGTEPEGINWYDYCEEKVVVTVVDSEIDQINNLIHGFGRAITEGFMLDWQQAADCGVCEASDGLCGYQEVTRELLCFCPDGSVRYNGHCKGARTKLRLKLTVGVSAGMGMLVICFVICCSRRKMFWRKKTKTDQNLESFIRRVGAMAPKRYSYSDIKKITNSLREKLGQGGYGGVYKGKLFDGRLVAVKILNPSKGNGEEFINEVASISRTCHVNVVSFLGFCLEGRKRALIYEFMPNGSLEKFIYGKNTKENGRDLGLEKLYQIAIGIARGLEYLHRGCNTRILHFDIKPHNILLDEEFCPKISDFGLAKLCTKKESIVSMDGARGTIGYIAPEVFNRSFGGVSHKSDVYSYGMMVLEMVGERRNVNVAADHTSEGYFPHWIYKRLEEDEDLGLQRDMTKEENKIARKMVLVALWCIQTDPAQRPSMSKVMEMLEGHLECLDTPPKPYLCSPARSPLDSSTISATL